MNISLVLKRLKKMVMNKLELRIDGHLDYDVSVKDLLFNATKRG